MKAFNRLLAAMMLVLLPGMAQAEELPDGRASSPASGLRESAAREGSRNGVRSARHERGEMTADRPELSVSSRTVARGRAQLEMEIESEHGAEGDASAVRWVAPSALLRVGVSDDVELRVASSLLVFQGSQSGLANATLGVKWNMVRGRASLGLLAQSTLPAGNPALRVASPRHQISLLGDIPLGEGWEARVNAGVASESQDGRNDIGLTASAAVFTRLGRSLELHAEYGRLGASRLHGGLTQVVDAGLALIVDEDTQVDLAGFKALSGESYDWKVVLGFGHRF